MVKNNQFWRIIRKHLKILKLTFFRTLKVHYKFYRLRMKEAINGLVYSASKWFDDINLSRVNVNSDEIITGRKDFNEHDWLNFAISDYLALDVDKRFQKEAIRQKHNPDIAEIKIGIESDLYKDANKYLFRIFNKNVLLFPEETHQHHCILHRIADINSAFLIDSHANSHMQIIADDLKISGYHVEFIPHSSIDMLESRIKILKNNYKKIWYLANGIYSMVGDYLPTDALETLFKKYDQFYLYVDDSHGMSWIGENGKGFIHHHFPNQQHIIMVANLNKGFGAAGAIAVSFDEELNKKLTVAFPDNTFSQNNHIDINSIVESAKIHLSSEIYVLQLKLNERIKFCNDTAQKLGLPIISISNSPIVFIAAGSPDLCLDISIRMLSRGFYISTAYFPLLPLNFSGLKIMISLYHSKTDIKKMLIALKEEFDMALNKRGIKN